MDKSKVYYYDNLSNLKAGVNKFFKMIAAEIEAEDESKIGIKIHFGEGDNDTHVKPELLKIDIKATKNQVKLLKQE